MKSYRIAPSLVFWFSDFIIHRKGGYAILLCFKSCKVLIRILSVLLSFMFILTSICFAENKTILYNKSIGNFMDNLKEIYNEYGDKEELNYVLLKNDNNDIRTYYYKYTPSNGDERSLLKITTIDKGINKIDIYSNSWDSASAFLEKILQTIGVKDKLLWDLKLNYKNNFNKHIYNGSVYITSLQRYVKVIFEKHNSNDITRIHIRAYN